MYKTELTLHSIFQNLFTMLKFASVGIFSGKSIETQTGKQIATLSAHVCNMG